MERDAPLGKSRKRFQDNTNTSTLRLASQAIYERPDFNSVGLGGFPAKSCYQATINSIQPDDATRRCIRERASVKFSSMVHDASLGVSLDRYKEIEKEVDAELSVSGRLRDEMAAKPPGPEPPKAEDMPSFEGMAKICAKDRDCRIKGAIVREFFGGVTGPTQLHIASGYYKTNRPYAGEIDVGRTTPKYSIYGYKLQNPNMMG